MTNRNVIVLTPGLAGSSLVAGLLADSGYWGGDSTFKKVDYDTHENPELIALNQRLLGEVGYCGNYQRVFRLEEIQEVAEKAQFIDPAPYRDFIARCNQHQPWLWKDPRLWLTIRFWLKHLDTERLSFLLVTREESQAWVSQVIRYKIQTPSYCRNYIKLVRSSIFSFFEENNLKYIEFTYEDLLLRPEDTIFILNSFLGSNVSMINLSHVNRGKLHKKQHGLLDSLKARMIYFKNYALRYR